MSEGTVTKVLESSGGISRYSLLPRPIQIIFVPSTIVATVLFVIHFSGWGYLSLLGISMVYPMFADKLPGSSGQLNWWQRVMASIGGFLIAFPELTTTIIGFSMTTLVILAALLIKRARATGLATQAHDARQQTPRVKSILPTLRKEP